MATVLITGATGGIGRYLSEHLGRQHDVISVSRRPHKQAVLEPCDLTKEVPRFSSDTTQVRPRIAWVVHLATSYDVDSDLRMIENLEAFAREHEVPHFLYVSSWVVHFPARPLKASYIRMKRACERRLMESGISGLRILRPSVVLGDGLTWTRLLRKLSPIHPLIPGNFSRSFVEIEDLLGTFDLMIDGMTDAQVITKLGQRSSLRSKARGHQSRVTELVWDALPLLLSVTTGVAFTVLILRGYVSLTLALLAALCFGFLVWKAVPIILGSVSDYFAGFVVRRFEPEDERELLALCHAENHNIEIRGYDNARIYFGRPNPPECTTVCLTRFNRVMRLDSQQKRVELQAGAHFGDVLPLLESEQLWLANYPNYHFISVGACVATPVHGSNLQYPFLVDLVQSVRYYDRGNDQVVQVARDEDDFQNLIFNLGRFSECVVLSAELSICDREFYRSSSQVQPVSRLRFEDMHAFIEEQAQHCEIRINTPFSKNATLTAYEPVDSGSTKDGEHLLQIKADAIGRKWNLLQSNALASYLTSSVSRCFINYEWFFAPQDFSTFWSEITSDRSRYRLYKLLVRYNRDGTDVDTPFHGTVSLDVTITNTREMKELSAALFEKFRPLEHLGKYSVERYIHERRRSA